MAEQVPAQSGQPGEVPPEKAEPTLPPSESAPGAPAEGISPIPSGEVPEESLQGPLAEPPANPPEPPRAAEGIAQEPEGASENFPCPFDEEIDYEIVEPPEGEESDDGFESIPPGPTEEVNFEPPRVRGPRRRRDRGRREGAPAEPSAPERKPEPAVKHFPIWLAVAGAVLLAAIIIVVILLATHGR
jgi:hypothetical protein